MGGLTTCLKLSVFLRILFSLIWFTESATQIIRNMKKKSSLKLFVIDTDHDNHTYDYKFINYVPV